MQQPSLVWKKTEPSGRYYNQATNVATIVITLS